MIIIILQNQIFFQLYNVPYFGDILDSQFDVYWWCIDKILIADTNFVSQILKQ